MTVLPSYNRRTRLPVWTRSKLAWSILRSAKAVLLAPYAMHSNDTRGREHAESEHPYRSPFQRDRDRIVHSTAFRRLIYKTQVFVNHEGDLYRTRLTHSLEVAQIGRSVAVALQLNEALTEAICLAHDLGHSAFGHSGEVALSRLMKDFGGFDHNAQSLRIVTSLEHRYATFDGTDWHVEVVDSAGTTGYEADLALDKLAPMARDFGYDGLELACWGDHFEVDKAAADVARKRIEQLTADVEVGKIYEGKVAKIMDFGAFVNILPGKDVLVHISQISERRIENVTDELSEGQEVLVKVLDVDNRGRVKLSMKEIKEGDQPTDFSA